MPRPWDVLVVVLQLGPRECNLVIAHRLPKQLDTIQLSDQFFHCSRAAHGLVVRSCRWFGGHELLVVAMVWEMVGAPACLKRMGTWPTSMSMLASKRHRRRNEPLMDAPLARTGIHIKEVL
jgi:hypothetical protein